VHSGRQASPLCRMHRLPGSCTRRCSLHLCRLIGGRLLCRPRPGTRQCVRSPSVDDLSGDPHGKPAFSDTSANARESSPVALCQGHAISDTTAILQTNRLTRRSHKRHSGDATTSSCTPSYAVAWKMCGAMEACCVFGPAVLCHITVYALNRTSCCHRTQSAKLACVFPSGL
jgi:hypothetical protein